MRKVTAGLRVKVMTGDDAGKIGVIQKVVASSKNGVDRLMVVVSDVNVKKFVKKGQMGKKMDSKPYPIDASNVMVMGADVPSRVGFKVEDGSKKRFLKKTGEFV